MLRGLRALSAAVLALALVATSGLSRPAAANCGAEGCPLAPRGPETRMGRFLFGLRYQFVEQDRLWEGSHQVSADEAYAGAGAGHEIEQLTRTKTWTVDARLHLLPRLELAAALPILDRVHQHSVEHHTGYLIPYEWHMQGAGDMVTSLAWTAFGSHDAPGHTVVLQAGVKLPTGETGADEVNGEVPEPPAQLGSGSTDWLAAVQYQRSFSVGAIGGGSTVLPLSLGLSGRINGRGTGAYQVGNSWQADLGGSYPLGKGLRALAQLNASGHARDDVGNTDAEPHETGGNVLFASPGLQADLLPGVSAFGYYQFRLYQHTNGPQLVSPYHLVFGLGYAFR